ncbi:MAG: YbjN domain-containing protein [Clostridia bacterium]|nr:YbjN domain-containing protein [Clostridia bacterium]
MAENNMRKAVEVYNTVCSMLDNIGWKYEKVEEKLMIRSGVKGDDLPIEFVVMVKPKNEVVQLLSAMPFNMPEDKRVEGALAICTANYGLIDGSFDYDLSDGQIVFRLTSSYRDSLLSEELIKYMVMVSAGTIDKYNDRFFMLAKGMITIEQFVEMEGA